MAFETYGLHTENVLSGKMMLYHVASQALLITTTTGAVPTVINPIGSDMDFVPVSLRISFISGTTTIGAVVIGETLNVGAGPATGAAIPSATLVTARSAYRGGPYAPRLLWAPTTIAFTAAPTAIMATGINLGAAAPTGSGAYECKFDGSLIFAPGTAMSIMYTVATSTALYQISLFGIEKPIT